MYDDTDDDALTVLLTPIQLSALLLRSTLPRGPSVVNRFTGAFGIIGGAVEMVASVPLWLLPEPASKVAAGALDIVGADTFMAGFRQVWTGRTQKTYSEQAVRASLRGLGVDEDLARNLASGTDLAFNIAAGVMAPLALAGRLQAARVASITRGVIDLEAEEGWPGAHTISRHVGKTTAELQARFAVQPRLRAASTFPSLTIAEQAVSEAIAANANDIRAWAALARIGERDSWIWNCRSMVGSVLVKGSSSLVSTTKISITLKKVGDFEKVYYVFTAYPVL